MPKIVNLASFWKPEACGQTVLPDGQILSRQTGGKCQNSNATFWVIFKHCDFGVLSLKNVKGILSFNVLIDVKITSTFLNESYLKIKIWHNETFFHQLCTVGSVIMQSIAWYYSAYGSSSPPFSFLSRPPKWKNPAFQWPKTSILKNGTTAPMVSYQKPSMKKDQFWF